MTKYYVSEREKFPVLKGLVVVSPIFIIGFVCGVLFWEHWLIDSMVALREEGCHPPPKVLSQPLPPKEERLALKSLSPVNAAPKMGS